MRYAVQRYIEQHGGAKISHGAIRGLVALLSGGETICKLLDLAAGWPGKRRPPLPQKVAAMKRWQAFSVDEYEEVSSKALQVM